MFDLVRTLWDWRREIAGVCALAGLGSVIITLFMPNYYSATTVFLASSPDQSKPEILFGNNPESEYFGDKYDIDRLLTIGESNELIFFMVDSFKLYAHYDIDSSGPRAEYRIKKKFSKHYELLRTKRDALELTIEDTDPEIAAAMANAARDRIDAIAQTMVKESQEKAMGTYAFNINRNSELVRLYSDSLNKYRAVFGIYNASAQSEALTTQLSETKAKLAKATSRLEILQSTPGIKRDTIGYVKAEVSGLSSSLVGLEEEMSQFNEGITVIQKLEISYDQTLRNLAYDEERLKRWMAAKSSPFPATILIEAAAVPQVKSRPKRSFLVIGSVAAAFLFSLIGVLLIDFYRNVDWNEWVKSN